eukprot:TRINITY_DN914_c0_g1_i1.p1 TRINITY_DN914_c0_g1~~TRINITY_DN914_c0_g1_i1.p1  ORF type:complete len:374 (+),score=73.80 TRINITY_DN914_c0_g1_i1:74-1195(+)
MWRRRSNLLLQNGCLTRFCSVKHEGISHLVKRESISIYSSTLRNKYYLPTTQKCLYSTETPSEATPATAPPAATSTKTEKQLQKELKKKQKKAKAEASAPKEEKKAPVKKQSPLAAFVGDLYNNEVKKYNKKGKFIKPEGWTKEPGTDVSLHKNIRKKAKLHFIFPDVIRDPFTPNLFLKVDYANFIIRKGSRIPPSIVKPKPQVSWPSKKQKWTLLMVSPDDVATGERPQKEMRSYEFIHWLVTNIPDNDISAGNEIASYIPAVPIKGANGPQRYVFLLFEQKGDDLNLDDLRKITDQTDFEQRKNFNTMLFLNEFNLKPSGMAFFLTSWGERVSDIYKEWGKEEPSLPRAPNLYARTRHLDVTRWDWKMCS